MRYSLFFIPLISVLFYGPALAGAEAKGFALPISLPGDSVLVKDTVKVNEHLTVIINTLKITDTTSRPVVVNGQWLKKRITVTEYVALPSDTIFTDAGTGSMQPETIGQTQTATPGIAANAPATKSVAVQPPVSNIETTEQPTLPTQPEPANQPETAPALTETAKTVSDEPVLLPTRMQNAAKKEKKDKKPAPSETIAVKQPEIKPAAIETTAPTIPANTEQSSSTSKVAPPVSATKTNEPAITNEMPATIPDSKPAENVSGTDANNDAAANISIEIIDNLRVIGVRTDLPDDNLPPGGTLILQLTQPAEDTQQPQKESNPQPKLNDTETPANEDSKPTTDNPVPPDSNSFEQVNQIPAETNSNLSVETTNTTERVVLESKVITLGEAYQLTLDDVRKQHDLYAKAYKKAKSEAEANDILRQAGNYLENIIANDIVYYWYGTGFDKEGTSVNPGSGRIACSYFVATMLTEAGLNIDRIKLAQQSAQSIIKTLSTPEHLTRCTTPAEVESLITQKGRGLYFIGFSYHVGFLYYNGSEIDLIHASPLPPGTVSRISMKMARSFEYSNFYDIGKLTDNRDLIVNWLTGKKMPIAP